MNAFDLEQLITRQAQQAGQLYLEFLRVPALSMGLYRLPAGGTDPQLPHTEDEVYYVISGQAQINVDGEDRPVQAGSIVFVEANAPHKFHSIEADLEVLVFFAPAEYTLKTGK
jgi:mannose-6-phosphate isomerase-like protein (cupin superfamily)